MEVSNSTFSSHIYDIAVGANDLMPWTFDPQTHFCATYQTVSTVVKEFAYLGFKIPNINPEGYREVAGTIGKVGLALFAIETFGDMICYGDSFSDKGGLLLKNAFAHAARTGFQALDIVDDTVINFAPFKVAAAYLNLVDRKETHYAQNGKLDENNIDLYTSFHTAISTGKVDTVRLLVEQYKQKFPNTPISFKQIAGDMDGLFLALGTEQAPKTDIVKLFMETGCNPNAVFNGKTPLDLISTYIEGNPDDLEAQHTKVYMTGMKKVIEDYNEGSNMRSIEGPSKKRPDSISSRKDVIIAPEGNCDGDECK